MNKQSKVLAGAAIIAGVTGGCAFVDKDPSAWDQQAIQVTVDDPRYVPENPSVADMIAKFKETSDVAVAFWTQPAILDRVNGGYSIWFDENGKQIEVTPELTAPYSQENILATFNAAIDATKLEDPGERSMAITRYQQQFEQTTKFLIPHLRVMYMHAVALNRCTDDAERRRLQAQLDVGIEYLEKFRDGDRFYNLLSYTGKPLPQNSLPPSLDYRWFSEYQTIATVYLLYVGAEVGRLTGDGRMIKYAQMAYDTLEKYAYDTEFSGYYNYLVPAGEKRTDTDKNIGLNMHMILGLSILSEICPECPEYQARQYELALMLQNYALMPEGLAYDFVARDWSAGDYSAIRDDQRILVGHNAELVWYLEQAAGKKVPMKWYTDLTAKITSRVRPDGAVYIWTALDGTPTPIFETRWWCQLEVMIMLCKMYELTGNEAYFNQLQQVVKYTYSYMVNPANGVWYAGYETKSGKKLYLGGMHWKSGLHLQRGMDKCIESLENIQRLHK